MFKNVRGRLLVAAATILCAATSLNLASTGGSSLYQIVVEDRTAGVGLGVYTVSTGFLHPVEASLGTQDILAGTGIPGTSFTTIRSYTSGTDYVQRNGLALSAGAPPTLELEAFVAAGEEAIPMGDPLNPTGFETIYRPGGFAAAPDDLIIRQAVEAAGTTFDDSAVVLRTVITNNGGTPVSVGIRYLWDMKIGPNDDGPSFTTVEPAGSTLSRDLNFFSPTFSGFEITDDNDPSSCFGMGNSPSPFYSVHGSVTGPSALTPTPPTRLAFVSWPDASGLPSKFGSMTAAPDAFDYHVVGFDVSDCLASLDDTGVAYWWGDTAANALIIAPGETISVEAYVLAHLPGMPPTIPPGEVEGPPGDPSCADGVDNDDDGLMDLDDPDCITQNSPPSCAFAVPSKERLWPPNHKYKTVMIDGVEDADGDPINITVTSIAQDEPLTAQGSGNQCPDAEGLGGDAVSLRAERSGLGDGRVYHIAFTADDGMGGQCTGEVTVCVPRDRKRGRTCIDQGSLFDSTQSCATEKRGRRGRP